MFNRDNLSPLSSDSDAQNMTASWISDFAKLGWKDTDLDWKNGEVEESQFIQVVKIERCPFDVPSFFLYSKKTDSRRFVSELKHPELYKLVHKLYGGRKVAPIAGSSHSTLAKKLPDLGLVDEKFIRAVVTVRYDKNIFNNDSAAYLVEWKDLPEMKDESMEPEWVEEKRMPECYVRVQRARQTEDILEYGSIDLAPTSDDQRSDTSASIPVSPSPVLKTTISLASVRTPTQQSKSSQNNSGARPRASQPFPLSSPEPYSSPSTMPQFEVSNFSDLSDSDCLEEISELLAKTRPPQSQYDAKSSTQAAKGSSRSSQAISATPRKVLKPSTIVNPKGETPSTSMMTSQPSKLRSPAQGNSKPKLKSGKSVLVSGPPAASQKATSAGSSSKSKGKRKAELLTQTSPGSLEPPVKRSKPNSIQPRKHEKFWHLDGNIIINIKNTHFKLHRSRLAEQSQYFADLFERKDGLTGMDVEEMDGRPVYTVTDVSVKDFEVLLTAMDNAITFYYMPPSFNVVASILRASTVLSFPHFQDWAVTYMEEMWSEELADLSTDSIPNASETVILGRKYNLPGVLKRAFYELLRTGRLGQQNDNISISSEDMLRLVHTREELSAAWLDTLGSVFEDFKCPNIAKTSGQPAATVNCPSEASKAAEWWKLLYASGVQQEYMYNVLCGLKTLIDHDWEGKDGYCGDCAKMRRVAWQKQRVKLWENLNLWLEL